MNALRGAPAAGRRCALRCEVSMSDKLQRPQSAYHGADPALANRWPNPVQTGRASAKDFLQPARIEDEGISRQIRTESSPFGDLCITGGGMIKRRELDVVE